MNRTFATLRDSKVNGINMGPIWVLSAPDWPHGGPMNLAIRAGPTTNIPNAPIVAAIALSGEWSASSAQNVCIIQT